MAVGIIAEYNPFHNGHIHQLKEAKKRFNNEDIIVIMSGKYVQRGELAIANFRKRKNMAIKYGASKVIEVRDKKSFDKWQEKLTSVNMLNSNARKFARILLGNTIEVTPDKTNRISLPDTFLEKTMITKEVAFVGVGNKIEIWAKDKFIDFQNDFEGETTIDDLAKMLLKDGVEL